MMKSLLRRILVSTVAFAGLLAVAPQALAAAEAGAPGRIEERLRSYLSNYLQPSEYLIVVRAKPPTPAPLKAPAKTGASLPGLPGFGGDAAAPGPRSYYDAQGDLHSFGDDHEPVTVQVILDAAVNAQKVALFKRILPTLGGLDPSRDSISVSTGQLERPAPKEPPKEHDPNWVDSLMKYKEELTSLGLGLLGAVCLLLVINGMMNALTASRRPGAPSKDIPQSKNETPKAGEPAKPAAPGSPDARPDRVGRLGLGNLNRSQVFSRDSMLYQTIAEINKEAVDHPERLARLLAEWVFEGKAGMAATLLNNFDMQTAEGVIAKMVPADVDRIQPHLTAPTEPFSDENYDVVTKARQDLIALSAKIKRDAGRQDFGFLVELDDEVLFEVLKGETPQTLALISTQVPPHRLNKAFNSLSEVQIESLFEELCRVNERGTGVRDETRDRLQKKVKAAAGLTLTDASKSSTMLGLLSQLRGTTVQKKVLKRIEAIDPAVSDKIRESIFFFDDALALSERHLRLLAVDVDVLVLTRALHGSPEDVQSRVRAALPKAAEEIYAFELRSNRTYSTIEVAEAQDRVVEALHRLEQTGRIKASDIRGNRTVPKKPRAAA